MHTVHVPYMSLQHHKGFLRSTLVSLSPSPALVLSFSYSL